MTPSILGHSPRGAHATGRAQRGRSAAPRLYLLVGCVAAIAIALHAGPSVPLRSDPELATLLRGMAAIKTLLVAAAIAAIAWRLGRPATTRIASSYLVGAWLVTGATTMIWQLSSIVSASALFHVGLLLLLISAWRDEAPFGPRFLSPRGRERAP